MEHDPFPHVPPIEATYPPKEKGKFHIHADFHGRMHRMKYGLNEDTKFDFRHARCTLDGKEYRFQSGYPVSGSFVVLLRDEHPLDKKADVYERRYYRAKSKRKRNKYRKAAQRLHYAANRFHVFYLPEKPRG